MYLLVASLSIVFNGTRIRAILAVLNGERIHLELLFFRLWTTQNHNRVKNFRKVLFQSNDCNLGNKKKFFHPSRSTWSLSVRAVSFPPLNTVSSFLRSIQWLFRCCFFLIKNYLTCSYFFSCHFTFVLFLTFGRFSFN